MQISFLDDKIQYNPPSSQLLKWVGNKQKFASEITKFFPRKFGTYFEPFLGSGAILATVSPRKAVGSDTYLPLIEIWQKLKSDPKGLIHWYAERRERISPYVSKEMVYKDVLASFNAKPNGADFLFLTRACYGGIVRFRKSDGYMSTPCGAHTPIPVSSFEKRVSEWHHRLKDACFEGMDYTQAFSLAKKGDLIYCDPPYSHSQSILYGAQSFSFDELISQIQVAKKRGVMVALSIDGFKKSGLQSCDLPIPEDLFEEEVFINLGRSMLRRFQMEGRTLESEVVSDRLLLTY